VLMRIGTLGSSQLGWTPFWFVTEVVRGTSGVGELTPGFAFRSLGCYEFMEEATAGIDWFRWLDFKAGSVEVTYRGEKPYNVWVISPVELYDQAVEELIKWVQDRDLETHDDNSFAICLHEGFDEFQDAVAWWSLADATVITLQEQVSNDLLASLQNRKAASDAERQRLACG
jgi:hypothetical protein